MGDDPLQVVVGLVPGFGFRRAKDRSHGDAERRECPGGAAARTVSIRAVVSARLTPEHVDIGVLRADRTAAPEAPPK